MNIIGLLSWSEAKRLIDNGNVVFVYPRNELAVVDGFKRYDVSVATVRKIKGYVKNNGVPHEYRIE